MVCRFKTPDGRIVSKWYSDVRNRTAVSGRWPAPISCSPTICCSPPHFPPSSSSTAVCLLLGCCEVMTLVDLKSRSRLACRLPVLVSSPCPFCLAMRVRGVGHEPPLTHEVPRSGLVFIILEFTPPVPPPTTLQRSTFKSSTNIARPAYNFVGLRRGNVKYSRSLRSFKEKINFLFLVALDFLPKRLRFHFSPLSFSQICDAFKRPICKQSILT